MLLHSESISINGYQRGPGFGYALIFSLACHILCIGYWQYYLKPSTKIKAAAQASEFSVILRSLSPEPTIVPELLTEIVTTIQEQIIVTQKEYNQTELKPEKIEGQREESALIIGNIAEIVRTLAAEPSNPLTVNGAVVMDRSLRKLLNRATRKSGYAPPRGGFRKDSILTAGTGDWTDFVDTGGNCYYIERANPTRPGSRDVWFRIECE